MSSISHINTRPNSLYKLENYFNSQPMLEDLKSNLRSGNVNSLIISGAQGSGVTHLLNAICNELVADKKVMYITAQWLVCLLKKCKTQNEVNALKQEFLAYNLISIDNIQFLHRKSAMYKTFLLELMSSGNTVILGCSEAGKDFTKTKSIVKAIHIDRFDLKQLGSHDIFSALKKLCSPEDNIPDKVLYAISAYNGRMQQHINCLVSIRFKSKLTKINLEELNIEEITELFSLQSYFPEQQLRRGYIQTRMSFVSKPHSLYALDRNTL